ncbi:MAG: LysR substrate-binding domain-containing protein [Rhizobiaceae bacterium]
MLTTRQLLYFEALAETGHFGRAAKQVHVSQPALSVQIAEMESDLGYPVVERRTGGAVLTSRGETLLTRVKSALEALRAIEAEARADSGFFDGKLRLGVIPTIAPYLLPSLVPEIRQAHPELQLEIKETTTAQLVAAIHASDIDAFVAAAPIDEPGLVSKHLFEDRFFIAGAIEERDILTSASHGEFPADRLLLLEEGHCLRDQALDVCGLTSNRRLVNYGATSMTTLLQMVEHGMGLTLVPEIAIEAETRHRDLAIAPFGDPAPSRSVSLFSPDRAVNVADHEELAEITRRAINRASDV